jgi:hypothetical protein
VTALEVTGAQEVAAHAARISHAQYDLMAATSNPITYLTQLANDTTAAVFNVGALPFNVPFNLITGQTANATTAVTTAANSVNKALLDIVNGDTSNAAYMQLSQAVTNLATQVNNAINQAFPPGGINSSTTNPIAYVYSVVTKAAIALFNVGLVLPFNVPLLTLIGQGTPNSTGLKWLPTSAQGGPGAQTTATAQVTAVATSVKNLINAVTNNSPSPIGDQLKQAVDQLATTLTGGVTSVSTALAGIFNPIQYVNNVVVSAALAAFNVGALAFNLPYNLITGQGTLTQTQIANAQLAVNNFVAAVSNSLTASPNPQLKSAQATAVQSVVPGGAQAVTPLAAKAAAPASPATTEAGATAGAPADTGTATGGATSDSAKSTSDNSSASTAESGSAATGSTSASGDTGSSTAPAAPSKGAASGLGTLRPSFTLHVPGSKGAPARPSSGKPSSDAGTTGSQTPSTSPTEGTGTGDSTAGAGAAGTGSQGNPNTQKSARTHHAA